MSDLLVASVLVALAAYRVWRLIGIDQITETLRAPLVESDSRLATFMLDLIGCAWCLGWWICLVIVALIQQWQGWGFEALLVWAASSTIVGFLGKLEQ